MARHNPRAVERVQQFRRLWDVEGFSGIAYRLRTRAADVLRPPTLSRLPVSQAEFEASAALSEVGWVLPQALPWQPGSPLRVSWVCTPPAPGSGGHTTMFRMVAALERAGHECVVYLRDQHGWSIDQHREIIGRWWPEMTAEVRGLEEGISDCHALFATGWDTAWAILGEPARGLRCYLVQDFEPSFYPAGSQSLLAEATYRFGFFGITAGRWLSQLLARDYAMDCQSFDFGYDLTEYALDSEDPGKRTGVCYYCRPSTPRRAHELAIAALGLFARQRPDVEIHFYGDPSGEVDFQVTQHGLLNPSELGKLYNRCVAGLVLSATNVSLVPYEMLAAGCIPVMNDAAHNRVVLDNDEVEYAGATPHQIAKSITRLVESTTEVRRARALSAASSVRSRTWDSAERDFVTIVENHVERHA